MSQTPEKITMVNIVRISPHPNQLEIYGEEPTDDSLLASIKEHGIRTPLILTTAATYYDAALAPFVCVSGHRRLSHAELAGLEVVPAIIRDYPDSISCDLDHVLLNSQREKTDAQRVAEFLQHKQILSQLGKLHQGKGTSTAAIFEDEQFSRILENLKIGTEKPLNSIEILKQLTGFSKHEQAMLNMVANVEYMQKKYNKYEAAKVNKADLTQLWQAWSDINTGYANGESTLTEAAKEVKALLKPFDAAVRKAKPKKERHVGKKLRKSRTPKKPSIDLNELFVLVNSIRPGYEELFSIPSDNPSARIGISGDGHIATQMHIYTESGIYRVNITELAKLAGSIEKAGNAK